jgi:glutathione S-transferase
MSLPILYSLHSCPYAMRARLALYASGIDYELRQIISSNKPAELFIASPKATLPVLVLPTGRVIDQSLDILVWALRQNDPYKWLMSALAPESSGIQDAFNMLSRCDGEFKFHLDRYKYPNRFANDVRSNDVIEHRDNAANFAALVNEHISQDRYDFYSYTGMYYAGCMPFIWQFAYADKAWFDKQPWPALQAALADFETSVPFSKVMDIYEPWQAGSEAVVISAKALSEV